MATDFSAAVFARNSDPKQLASALQQARLRTLGLLDAYVAKLGTELLVPYSPELNPPRWEVGHVAWFCDYWLARNQQRRLGIAGDPDHARPVGRLAEADALYNSSRVAHATRWTLPLPDLATTRRYLNDCLDAALELLATTPETPDDLYFFRLVLFHQDMHAEAACYMAQALDIPLPEAWRPRERSLPAARQIGLPATTWRLGVEGEGFAFDNELPAHHVELAPFAIDNTALSWSRFLPAVEAGAVTPPRYLRCHDGVWQARRYGHWQSLALDTAAVHLSRQQALDWCAWAGRRLPSEAEWEYAALSAPDFVWGEVWEWTASRFVPFPGFVAHPYRDYSRPAFDENRFVLKGASRATSPRLAHPKYRNYFTPERGDIHGGFRSCAG